MIRDRAKGALWGQAIGDAFGTTNEFNIPASIKDFPLLNTGPQTDIIGGGPFGLQPGQITDDTQMAVCLAESLKTNQRYDVVDVGQRYVEWMDVAFDIGGQTISTLTKIRNGSDPVEAGLSVWESATRKPAANGSLMRVSPIPVFFCRRH